MKEDDSIFNSKLYASLGDAWDDVRGASGVKDTAIESAKLVGKTTWNVAVFSGKFGITFMKEMPKLLAQQMKK